jgi:hypothetical protein
MLAQKLNRCHTASPRVAFEEVPSHRSGSEHSRDRKGADFTILEGRRGRARRKGRYDDILRDDAVEEGEGRRKASRKPPNTSHRGRVREFGWKHGS